MRITTEMIPNLHLVTVSLTFEVGKVLVLSGGKKTESMACQLKGALCLLRFSFPGHHRLAAIFSTCAQRRAVETVVLGLHRL